MTHDSTAWEGFVNVGLTYEYDSAGPSDPITDIPQTPSQAYVSSGTAGWTSLYDIKLESQVVTIDLDLMLVGFDPGDDLRKQWKDGIEGIWSENAEITDGTFSYPIEVNVNWVTQSPHFVIYVSEGSGVPTMAHWYAGNPGGWGSQYHDEIAAHEAGHMMGLYDEYPGGTLDPETSFTTTNSIMADLGAPRTWHYDAILAWLAGQVDVDLSLASSPLPPYPRNVPLQEFHDGHPGIPEPATGVLLGIALLGLAGFAWRRRRAA